MRAFCIGLLWVLVGCAPHGGRGFSVRLLDVPPQVLQGEPVGVTLEVTNDSGVPILVEQGMGGLVCQVSASDSEGRPLSCTREESGSPMPGSRIEELPAGWRSLTFLPMPCIDKPGRYRLRGMVAAGSPPLSREATGTEPPQAAWVGKELSQEKAAVVREPSGVDREAFSAMGGCPLCDRERLLKEFPTSAYAGWVFLPSDRCLPDPRVFSTALRDEAPGAETELRLATLRTRAQQLRSYLEVRPDFTRASWLKVELAGLVLALGSPREALALCEKILAEDPEGSASQKAKMLEEFIRARGHEPPNHP